MKKRALFLSLLSLAFIAGCGENAFKGQEDKNSTEAKKFDISANLDSGNYQAVLNDPNNASATDYAAAAMGAAGLDPVNLIKQMNNASTTGQSNDLDSITSNIQIDPTALDELQAAKTKLATELASNPSDPDLNFQAAQTALASTVTSFAAAGQLSSLVAAKIRAARTPNSACGANPTTLFNLVDNITADEANDLTDGMTQIEAKGLGWYICNVYADGEKIYVLPGKDLVALIAEDVGTILDVVVNDKAALGAGSDLSKVLNEAMRGVSSTAPACLSNANPLVSTDSQGVRIDYDCDGAAGDNSTGSLYCTPYKGVDYNCDGRINQDDLTSYLNNILGQ